MSTPIPTGVTYEYLNNIRDVDPAFRQLVEGSPLLLSIIPVGPTITNPKHEWNEDSITDTVTAITAFDVDGDGTGISVTSTVGIEEGSILRITTAADVSRTEQVIVASVDNATDLTVVRDYGGTTGETFVVGDKVYLLSTPLEEATDPDPDAGQEPIINFNYTQIFDRTAKVSRTQIQTNNYSFEQVGNAMNYEVNTKMIQIMKEMNKAVIYGRRVQRTGSTVGLKGSMGGVLQFMEGGNIDATGGVISSTILNNMFEEIYLDGGQTQNVVIVCNTNQSKRISSFLIASNEPTVYKVDGVDQQFGNRVTSFTANFASMTPFSAQIIVDPSFPKDQVAVLTLDDLSVHPMQALTDSNAAPNGADYAARRILGEYTLKMKNGKKSAALAIGLTV